MTLGAELAEHRYPYSPRRIRVLRCRRVLRRYESWLRAALRRNRHDNPVSRVSVTLSTESRQSCRKPENRCAATLLATSRTFGRNLLDPRSWAVPTSRQGSANLNTWVRQLCAKGQIRRSHPQNRRRRVERPVINPPTGNKPTRGENERVSLPGRPRHTLSVTLSRTLSETLQLQVRHNVRELENASPTATPKRREHRNDTLLRGLLTLC